MAYTMPPMMNLRPRTRRIYYGCLRKDTFRSPLTRRCINKTLKNAIEIAKEVRTKLEESRSSGFSPSYVLMATDVKNLLAEMTPAGKILDPETLNQLDNTPDTRARLQNVQRIRSSEESFRDFL